MHRIQLISFRFAYDIDFFTRSPEEFQKEINEYLIANGIPEDFINMTAESSKKYEKRFDELNEMIEELLAKKIPKQSIFLE